MKDTEVKMCLHIGYASDEIDEAIRLCDNTELSHILSKISEFLCATYIGYVERDEKQNNPPTEGQRVSD